MSDKREFDTVIANCSELDLVKTFECGQCFRWNADRDGVYTGVVGSRVLRVKSSGQNVVSFCPESDSAFWHDYFDLDADYAGASKAFTEPEYLRTCAEYGAGIRILRQEPWEALCSFIISQCNNIPRIKKIVETLCRCFGEELESGIYSFPGPEKLAPLSVKDLAPLHCGYRDEYILSASRDVCEGRLDFDELRKMDGDEALKKIKSMNGVGDKVANCFMLYGLHRMERFPIDVWMKRALKAHFPPDFDPAALGRFSGLAQQYIFYYARSGDGESAEKRIINCDSDCCRTNKS